MTEEIHYSIQIPLGTSVTCSSGNNGHGKEKKSPMVTWHIISKKKEDAANNNPLQENHHHFEMEATDLTKLMNTLNQIQIRCDQLQH